MKPILSRLAAFGGLLLLAACTSTPAPEPYGALPTPEQVAWQRMEMNLFRPLRAQHLHRLGVGRRPRGCRCLRPHGARLPPVGGHRPPGGHEGDHPHGQASRRILPLAQPPQAAIPWPKAAGATGRATKLRELFEACRAYGLKFGVHLAVGPQRSLLWHGRLQRGLLPHA